MLNVLVVHKFSEYVVLRKSHIPRMGEAVGWIYAPYPRVKDIINYPTREVMNTFNIPDGITDIDVILILD